MPTASRSLSVTWSPPRAEKRNWPAAIDTRDSAPRALRQDLPQRLDVRRARTLAPYQHDVRAILSRRQAMHGDTLAFRECREHALRQQRDAHAGDHAAQHRVVGAELDRTSGHLALVGVKILQPLAVGTAVLEGEDARRKRPFLADRRMSRRRYDHDLLGKCE